MTARDLTPIIRNAGYEHYLANGLCPNSKEPCAHLGKLVATQEAVRESLEMTSADSSLKELAQNLAERATGEVQGLFDAAMQDTAACLGGCAVAHAHAVSLQAETAAAPLVSGPLPQ
ncbi:MAG TPA: hypothetical protein VFI74_02970 [Candidatus Saccharimonadales bacterium]|nr:hypothetical protein [Candidatus Saccharimonadales bacterium]